jgi:hypothetical protein
MRPCAVSDLAPHFESIPAVPQNHVAKAGFWQLCWMWAPGVVEQRSDVRKNRTMLVLKKTGYPLVI